MLVTVMTQPDAKTKWTVLRWSALKDDVRYRKNPLFVLSLFGWPQQGGDLQDHLRSTPMEELSEAQDALEEWNDRSLPATLKILATGSREEKIDLLLKLHRRLYHRPPAELRTLLHRAGVPWSILPLVQVACSLCTTCRAWQLGGTRPASKVRLAARFNEMIMADLVYFGEPKAMFLFIVDEAIRFTTITFIEYKNFASIESAFRRGWTALFGPPQRLRSDRESVLSSDAFGCWCESQSINRELYNIGKDGHGGLSVLDRRVQMFKETAKRLSSSLAEETIRLDPADLAAECQYCLNSQLSHRGVSPYVCLFGIEPSPIFKDDASEISSMVLSEGLPFYQHQQVRMRAVASFQGSLLQHRLARATVARPRSSQDEALKPNMLVDFYRIGNKELSGWRGPATLLTLLGNGLCSVRWQSTTLDVPTHHVRQHLTLLQYDGLEDQHGDPAEAPAAAPGAPAAIAAEACVTELDDITGEQQREL